MGLSLVPVACVSLAEVDVVWATQSEGEGATLAEIARGISTLSDGSSIVTGSFTETATFGVTTLESAGLDDVFVAKLDASGNWVWAARAGSSNTSDTVDVDIDETGVHVSTLSDGSSIVTGYFTGNATFGAATLESAGSTDIFVAKIDASGNWVWATRAGGTSSDLGWATSTLSDGSSFVTGKFSGTATFGSTELVSEHEYSEVFVAKLDASGNFVWATRASGLFGALGLGISTLSDDGGSAIVTGAFGGYANFGDNSLESLGGFAVFVAKVDASGDWVWATSGGGTSNDLGWATSTLSDGSSIVTGEFIGTATFGAATLESAGGRDIFVAKVDASGNWVWAARAGSNTSEGTEEIFEVGYAVSTLTDGSSIVTGRFKGTATFGTNTLDGTGVTKSNLFVAKIDASGNWVWAKTVEGNVLGFGVSTLSDDSAIVSGFFGGTAAFGSTTLESAEGASAFVAKFSSNPSDPPLPVTTLPTFALLLLSMLLGLFGYRRLAH